jgi:MFS family permease
MSLHSQYWETESDENASPAELASGGMGLMLAVGVLLGAIVGALLGNYLLDDAFGWDVDFLIGALVGAVVGVVVNYSIVKYFTSKVAKN